MPHAMGLQIWVKPYAAKPQGPARSDRKRSESGDNCTFVALFTPVDPAGRTGRTGASSSGIILFASHGRDPRLREVKGRACLRSHTARKARIATPVFTMTATEAERGGHFIFPKSHRVSVKGNKNAKFHPEGKQKILRQLSLGRWRLGSS